MTVMHPPPHPPSLSLPLIAYSTYLALFTPLALSLFLPPLPTGRIQIQCCNPASPSRASCLCPHTMHSGSQTICRFTAGMKRTPVVFWGFLRWIFPSSSVGGSRPLNVSSPMLANGLNLNVRTMLNHSNLILRDAQDVYIYIYSTHLQCSLSRSVCTILLYAVNFHWRQFD